MTGSTTEPTARTEKRTGVARKEPVPRWKKILIGVAGVFLVSGLLLGALGGESDGSGSASPAGTTSPGAPANSLLPTGSGTGSPDAGATGETGKNPWAGGLTRMGFSFFVGFAVGYLVRAFLRVALVVVGLLLLLNSLLAYAGFVTVNWEAMEQAFNAYVGRLGSDFEHFSTMVTGRLPQAGLGALGLVAGLKKH